MRDLDRECLALAASYISDKYRADFIELSASAIAAWDSGEEWEGVYNLAATWPGMTQEYHDEILAALAQVEAAEAEGYNGELPRVH